ncbi:MAG: TIGR02117 family protein [Saprospiraceae bacterium]|nr:TIGR02117 family protein [Saprospiraceae bacterium]
MGYINFKSFLKVLKIFILSLMGFILLYLASAFILSRIAINGHLKSKDDLTIYILTNGVHTDIVVPVKTAVVDWTQWVKFEHTKAKDTTVQYVAFGWGDKGFYLETPTWAELKWSVAFKAAFALSTSAIHASFYHQLKESENCKSIRISNGQYQQLVQYIQKSFKTDQSGQSIHIGTDAHYSMHDAFYEAVGRYHLFKTCNTWANNALKSCGQKASLWTAFDTGIFYHYGE